jgi:hypothetical protein
MQWSADETICARQSANGVQLYNGHDFTAPTVGKIVLPVREFVHARIPL